METENNQTTENIRKTNCIKFKSNKTQNNVLKTTVKTTVTMYNLQMMIIEHIK
jgi:hypothetical protein